MNIRPLPTFLLLLASAVLLGAETKGPSPDEALARLKEGQARFVAGALTHPNQDAARRLETAKGQNPYAAVLACADSRESLDTIFDAGIGDLFTIRVAGNVADVDEIASLEYGAEHLKVPLILVLGHTSCGAVTAVVKKSELAGQLPGLLDNIQAPAARAVAKFGPTAADLVDQTARENVLQSIQDLLTRSAVLSELVKKQELRIVGGLYHLDTGSIEWMESLPALDGWVAQGVAYQAPVASAPANAWLWTALLFLGSLGFLALVQKLFVSPRRVARSLRIGGRLVVSYLAVLAVLAGGMVAGALTGELLPLLGALLPAFVFAFLYSRAHRRGFEAFYRELKEKWEARANSQA